MTQGKKNMFFFSFLSTGYSAPCVLEDHNVTSATFSGSGSKLDFGNTLGNFGLTSWAMSFWIKTGNSSRQYLMSKNLQIAEYDGWFVQIAAGGKIQFFLDWGDEAGTPALAQNLEDDSLAVSDNVWHHVLIGHDRVTENMHLYVDNNPGVRDISVNTGLDYDNTGNFQISGRQIANDLYFTGDMTEVQMFDKMPTASQVTALYNTGKPVVYSSIGDTLTATTVMSLALDSGDPSTVDVTGKGNNATGTVSATGSAVTKQKCVT